LLTDNFPEDAFLLIGYLLYVPGYPHRPGDERAYSKRAAPEFTAPWFIQIPQGKIPSQAITDWYLSMKKLILIPLFTTICLSLSACSPEVGSEKWCAKLKEKPKGDWSSNEAKDYAKYCLFK
jgi:hypothetical protein